MPLYSTDVHSKAVGQPCDAGGAAPAEGGVEPGAPWCYLFVHHARVAHVDRLLGARFKTFVHKTVTYKKENGKITARERQTISGLIFVQGDKGEIQDFLRRNCQGVRLADDCSTKATAVIPDRIMRPFMHLDTGRNRIRFMPHPLSYYSEGHPRVRVTSGLLAGFEGYNIRISRNKCLVTSIGGLTVAIGGISMDSFENIDEYVRLRRSQQRGGGGPAGLRLTGMEECFFTPQSQLDVAAIALNLRRKVRGARACMEGGGAHEAAGTALSLLEEAGAWLRAVDGNGRRYDVGEVKAACGDAERLLDDILSDGALPEGFRRDLQERRRKI